MSDYRILLIMVMLLSGCGHGQSPAPADARHKTTSKAACSERAKVLHCDWDNVTYDWKNADSSVFTDDAPRHSSDPA